MTISGAFGSCNGVLASEAPKLDRRSVPRIKNEMDCALSNDLADQVSEILGAPLING